MQRMTNTKYLTQKRVLANFWELENPMYRVRGEESASVKVGML